MCALRDVRIAERARLAELRAVMARDRVGAVAVVSPANQTYLVGFRALLYSRPIVLIVAADSTALVVPALEEAHARDVAAVDELLIYYEHPGGGPWKDSVTCVDRALGLLAPGRPIGIEHAACPAGLAAHLTASGHRLVDLDPALTRMRAVKDEIEIAVIREAGRVAGVGVTASLDACRVGRSEIEIDGVGTAAVMAEVAGLGSSATVEQLIMTPSGLERTSLPMRYRPRGGCSRGTCSSIPGRWASVDTARSSSGRRSSGSREVNTRERSR